MKKKDEYTATEFAKKIGVHKSTVMRWLASKDASKFKAHDAEVVEVAGKKFIKILKR